MEAKRKFIKDRRDAEQVFYLTVGGTTNGKVPESIVWFVNNSEETLDSVENASGGFATFDDEVATMTLNSPKVYRDVRPGEAVAVDTHDVMFDGDFLVQFGVTIVSPSLGHLTLEGTLDKGGHPNETLAWKPLPPEMYDDENEGEFISPEKVAATYIQQTGNFLPKTVFINYGDLMHGYASDRLEPSGLHLKETLYHGGAATHFEFFDRADALVFQTCDPDTAYEFICALKSNPCL
jgi:hypothetical protein